MKPLRRFATVFTILALGTFVGTTDAQEVQVLSRFDELAVGHTIAQTIALCEFQVAASELHVDEEKEELTWWKILFFGALFTGKKLGEVAWEMGPFPNGLTRSRWAMDDPEYASKYANGAKKTDIAGKVKQASDARFQSGSSGWYASGGLTALSKSDNPLASLELGFEGYPTSFATYRMGLLGAINEDAGYFGGEFGCRIQTPTRLAPFVGAGTFAGFASQTVSANDDGIDNDMDSSVDEADEERRRLSGALLGIYPETGAHFWWTPRVRLTGYGRYLITTEGRDADSWLLGFGVALMSEP